MTNVSNNNENIPKTFNSNTDIAELNNPLVFVSNKEVSHLSKQENVDTVYDSDDDIPDLNSDLEEIYPEIDDIVMKNAKEELSNDNLDKNAESLIKHKPGHDDSDDDIPDLDNEIIEDNSDHGDLPKDLSKHLILPTLKKNFVENVTDTFDNSSTKNCSFCKQSFQCQSTIVKLLFHKCDICSKKFLEKSRLKKHIKNLHFKEKFDKIQKYKLEKHLYCPGCSVLHFNDVKVHKILINIFRQKNENLFTLKNNLISENGKNVTVQENENVVEEIEKSDEHEKVPEIHVKPKEIKYVNMSHHNELIEKIRYICNLKQDPEELEDLKVHLVTDYEKNIGEIQDNRIKIVDEFSLKHEPKEISEEFLNEENSDSDLNSIKIESTNWENSEPNPKNLLANDKISEIFDNSAENNISDDNQSVMDEISIIEKQVPEVIEINILDSENNIENDHNMKNSIDNPNIMDEITIIEVPKPIPEVIDISDSENKVQNKTKPKVKNKNRSNLRNRCGKCKGCKSKNCGKCKFCLDKPQYGGHQILKQCCTKRVCRWKEIKGKYDCKKCHRNFIKSNQLKEHISKFHVKIIEKRVYKRKNQKQQFQCKTCDFKTSYRNKLTKHYVEFHLDENKFCCDKCKFKFSTRFELIKHFKKVHGNAVKPMCSICNKTFVQITELKLHLYKFHKFESCHQNENDKKNCERCEICRKNFKTIAQLRFHLIKIHKNFKIAKNLTK